jgi:hypothetical protein
MFSLVLCKTNAKYLDTINCVQVLKFQCLYRTLHGLKEARYFRDLAEIKVAQTR